MIYQGLDEATLEMVAPTKTSKEAWEMLNKTYSGVEKIKKKGTVASIERRL